MDEVPAREAGQPVHASKHPTLHLQAHHQHRGGICDPGQLSSAAAHLLISHCCSAGVPAVRQTLSRAPPAARRVWKQRRRGDPLHGGGCRGHRALLDQRGHAQGPQSHPEQPTVR